MGNSLFRTVVAHVPLFKPKETCGVPKLRCEGGDSTLFVAVASIILRTTLRLHTESVKDVYDATDF